jgi:non-ribosomal peptide synthetase component F
VVLLGHKEPDMLVGMFGSMLSGHAYVPLDASFPAQRVAGILEQLGQGVVIEMRAGLIDSLCSGVSNVSFSFISFEKLQEI